MNETPKPYGYIYVATNSINGKNYVGQTVTSRWEGDKIPIEERWKEEVREAHAKQSRGENLRYVENAILKYGPENFNLNEQDKAQNQEELNEKENMWMIKYDSLNQDKGYNVMEVGRGGRLTQYVKEKMSNSHKEKWQKDLVYQQKQLSERQERAKDPEWLEKMAKVNQEIARNPKTLEKMSESISAKWQEKEYQENVSKGVTGKWQEEKFRERQFNAKLSGKREIPDKREFLKEIQGMKKKDLNKKYDMDGKCINDRIEEMLGHHGIKNFSQAKNYLEDKNLDEILKDINERLDNQPQKIVGKKEIPNKREFLEDIQKMKSKEIERKYDMNRTTVNKRIREMLGDQGVKNYTEARNYLEDKNLDEVVKGINERLNNQSEKYERKTIISNKREFLEDIQSMQKNEIDHKYGMDAKTINNKIKDMLDEQGVKNYTEAKAYLKNNNIDDVLKDIEKRGAEKPSDNQIIKENSKEKKEKDIKKGETSEEKREDTTKEKKENTEKGQEEHKKEGKVDHQIKTSQEKQARESPEKPPEQQKKEIQNSQESEQRRTREQPSQSEIEKPKASESSFRREQSEGDLMESRDLGDLDGFGSGGGFGNSDDFRGIDDFGRSGDPGGVEDIEGLEPPESAGGIEQGSNVEDVTILVKGSFWDRDNDNDNSRIILVVEGDDDEEDDEFKREKWLIDTSNEDGRDYDGIDGSTSEKGELRDSINEGSNYQNSERGGEA